MKNDNREFMYISFRHIVNTFGWKSLLFLFFLLFTTYTYAQNRVISGTVSDDMGPIMMANVVEKDTKNRIVSA